MMWIALKLILNMATAVAASAEAISPADLLQRGIVSYQAAHYTEAIESLRNAESGFLTAFQKQVYTTTGKLEALPQIETSLVYLAMSQARLGHRSDLHETIRRLVAADAMHPTFATLPLKGEVSEIEAIIRSEIPPGLPPNNALAALIGVARGSTSEITAGSATSGAANSNTGAASGAAPIGIVEERQLMLQTIGQKVAEAKLEIERSTTARIAEIERACEERVAAERLRAERAEASQVATERQKTTRQSDGKRADERDSARGTRQSAIPGSGQQKPAAGGTATDRTIEALSGAEALSMLREAGQLADSGEIKRAAAIYENVATSPGVTRSVLTPTAVGLYRIGHFEDAAAAFRGIRPYGRGEEDLRYYAAVSLFETGRFEEAARELSCALPYLEVTDEITRYQSKIEEASSFGRRLSGQRVR